MSKTIIEKIESKSMTIVHALCINILVMSFVYSLFNFSVFYTVVTLIGIFYFFTTTYFIHNRHNEEIKNISISIKE